MPRPPQGEHFSYPGEPPQNGVPGPFRGAPGEPRGIEYVDAIQGSRLEDGIQLEEVLDLLYRGKWIILVTFLLITAGVAIYTFSLTPEYEASALLLVHPREKTSIEDALEFSSGGVFARDDRSLANELVVLRNSLNIARNVSRRLLEMRTVPGTMQPLSIIGSVEEWQPEVEDVARRLQWRYINIQPEGRDVDVIRVTATSTVPQEAALLANLYSEEYVKLTQDASRSRLSASREFLEQQEEMRRDELRQIEAQVEDYMSREGAVALDSEGEMLVTQISELESQRDAARIELQMRQASLQSLEKELAQIHPQLAQRVASGVEREIHAAQQKVAELEATRQQIYLRNPDLRSEENEAQLRSINSQIAQLRQQIDVLARQYVDEVLAVGGIDLSVEGGGLQHVSDLNRQVVADRIAISGLLAKIDVMERRLSEQEVKLRNLPEQAIQLAQLQRARQSAERMYTNVVEKLQEVRIAEQSELGYADVIREALVPAKPVRPNKERNILVGALLALMLGVGLAALRKGLDNRVYTPEDLRHQGESVVGIIPDMARMVREDFDGQAKVELDGKMLSTSLVTLLNPMANIAESYRHLRTNIQFSRPDAVVQTILVTSANPGEGKTVTAANLGVVMAQSGRRTLIVDCDVRRPNIHEQMGVPREPGLVQLLFSSGDVDLKSLETGVDDLYVLPAGRSVPNPAELIGSKRMRELLDEFKGHFDVVIVDSPPVLVATDAVLLSTQCDATLLVVAAASTKKHELAHAREALDGVGAKVVGGVLNGFDATMAYGYGYKYSYYYKYYSRYGYGYGYADGDRKKTPFMKKRGRKLFS